MKGAVSAFGFGLRIKSHRDNNYIRLRCQLLGIGKNIGSYARNSHMQASAKPFGLTVMLENNFVRSGVERKRRDTQYFLRRSPIVEHDLVINEDAVIASVFSRGGHEEIVFAGSTRRVVTGPARGQSLCRQIRLAGRRPEINTFLGASEKRR